MAVAVTGDRRNDEDEEANLKAIVEVLKRDLEILQEENRRLKTVSSPKPNDSDNSRPTNPRGWETVPPRSRQNSNRHFKFLNESFPPLISQSNKYAPLLNIEEQDETIPSPNLKEPQRTKPIPRAKPKAKHHIKIYGDSFGRGMSKLIGNSLSGNFAVEGLIKPSATLKDVVPKVPSSDALSEEDFVVIIGGANDIYRNETKEATSSLRSTLTCALKNTNVVYVNIPHRFDLTPTSIVNQEIVKANIELRDICKDFKNVTLINTSNCGRLCHTKHGQHFNLKGKRVLANTILQSIKNKLGLAGKGVTEGNHRVVNDQGNVRA
jgi:lysophospholipase L1-like esterase